MQYFYLAILVFSLCGLFFADYSRKIFFFSDSRGEYFTQVVISIAVLITIDLVGILLGIFSSNPLYISFFLAPHFPLEELFFLGLLSYSSLFLWKYLSD